jgi:hypothetical protein
MAMCCLRHAIRSNWRAVLLVCQRVLPDDLLCL